MKGKAKNKRKIGRVILIGMGFFLAVILTFTTTLAWFYDSDWASRSVTMAGTVGIRVKDGTNFTSGSGQLHFQITTDKAYPGQAIDVSASCYNDGGKSGLEKGSQCYVRAHFAVYTNIGKLPVATDYVGGTASKAYIKAKAIYDATVARGETPGYAEPKGSDYEGGTNSNAYKEDYATALNEKDMCANELYTFLHGLIKTQNTLFSQTGYYWNYYRNTGAMPLSSAGTLDTDINYFIDGKEYVANGSAYTYTYTDSDGATQTDSATATELATLRDKGYFYLCTSQGEDAVLKILDKNEESIFLWNDTFIIPWRLTNASAEKEIFVAVEFQAIQTYIPIVSTAGLINTDPDNQVKAENCTIKNRSVQTVFNSCAFTPISTKITIDGVEKDFGDTSYYDVKTNKEDAGITSVNE